MSSEGVRLGFLSNARTFARPKKLIFPSLVDEIVEPCPDMNIKVAAFTVSEKSIIFKILWRLISDTDIYEKILMHLQM